MAATKEPRKRDKTMIGVWLEPDDYERVRQAAFESRESVSAYARRRLLAALKRAQK